ncbi:toll/interleukin-1 receptor domain-containing protein [Poritiphilus flavus]|uniref:TIR domain-containing protein n=1 Tax=Poritiphilus flavus TaxID=2697053 RepID=A0A6L9EG02_9FLAO|nr:toll/interleukin-1 receptor domain-containing protein [Poritiphilus flavus]NAS13189.1 TIR domain-containing protein [Poritiphilus flavus]
MQESAQIPAVYISYAWNEESESLAKAIEKEFQEEGIQTIRDKKHLSYKGRIRDFMNEIGRGKYIILIISNKYLRSEHCMFELLQIFKSGSFYERIFPVVMDEVKISKASDRLTLVKYWEDEATNLDEKIRELKALSNIQGVTEDLNLYAEIRNNMARLTNILRDINTLNTSKHISSDFHQLKEQLKARIREDFQSKKPVLFRRRALTRSVLTLLILAVVAFGFVLMNRELNGKENEIPLVQKDSLEVAMDSTEVIGETMNPPPKKEASPEKKSNVSYSVLLTVPSNMTQAAVFVDGKPAEVLKRDLIFIEVRVWKKDNSHHFEIRDGGEQCTTERMIEEDNVEIALCI